MATPLFFVMVAAFVLGTIAPVLWPSGSGARRVSLSAALIGCLAGLGLGARVLVTRAIWTFDLPRLMQPLGGVSFTIDSLGAFFLIIVTLTGVPAVLYAQGYARHLDTVPRGRVMHALVNVFLAGMCFVAAASNVLTFLFSWELMAVSSYLLVVSDAEHEDTPAAGLWYAAMTHAGFLALLLAFLILAQQGPFDFASLRAHGLVLPAGSRLAVFLLGVFAFGSKAGLVPLHVWLPRAHPAAPSHVSALMSAAMVKLGVYGVVRLLFDLLPAGPPWWGGALLAAGVVTALTGVLYSVADTHLKRVLAYSTIENVGLIFIGVGFALVMRGYGYPALAALGLVVGLLHTLNHAVFKSVLFLGAGAVIHATHATSLEAFGGLIKRMPQTAALCLVGALSLAALPPLNGFPSEWLTFQLLVAGARHTAPALAIVLPLALAGVALVAGLAAVSAIRLFGITFLALPRTSAAASAVEATPIMRVAMALPASACVFLGLLPTVALPALGRVASELGLPFSALDAGTALALPLVGSRLWPIGLTVLLFGVGLGLAVATRRRTDAAHRRIDTAWNCGRLQQSPRSEYTAAAFAEPLRRVFSGFYRPTQEVTVDVHPGSRYFERSVRFRGTLTPWMEQALYAPVIGLTRWASRQTRRLQAGSIHMYLALLPVALLVLLFIAQWVR